MILALAEEYLVEQLDREEKEREKQAFCGFADGDPRSGDRLGLEVSSKV